MQTRWIPKFFTPCVFLVLAMASSGAQGQARSPTAKPQKQAIVFVMFEDFETLDVFGPAEIFGRLADDYEMGFYSLAGGVVSSKQGVPIMTRKLADMSGRPHILLVPGGMGTRVEVNNVRMVEKIKALSLESQYVLTVCTGSALLAKTGLLDGRQATSNKRAFAWASSQGAKVVWDKNARWKVDGKYYTSSGVSAGMDMALGFIADRHGVEKARKVATGIEYLWEEDPNNDTFKAQ